MSQPAVEVPRISGVDAGEVQRESTAPADDGDKADEREKPVDVAQV